MRNKNELEKRLGEINAELTRTGDDWGRIDALLREHDETKNEWVKLLDKNERAKYAHECDSFDAARKGEM